MAGRRGKCLKEQPFLVFTSSVLLKDPFSPHTLKSLQLTKFKIAYILILINKESML